VPLPAAAAAFINCRKGIIMNKNQIEGRVDQAKGKLKEAAGKLIGNEQLQVEGRVEQAGGKLQAKVGDIKQAAKDKARDLIDKI